jgi:DNA-directed RNA polymerase subunit M/transcription elongation factor TFIIS
MAPTREAAMRCPQCKNTDAIQIEIRLTDQQTVQFFSCRICEARWWEQQGDTIALDDVLKAAAKK